MAALLRLPVVGVTHWWYGARPKECSFITTACTIQREHSKLLQRFILFPIIPLPQCMCRSFLPHAFMWELRFFTFPCLAISADSVLQLKIVAKCSYWFWLPQRCHEERSRLPFKNKVFSKNSSGQAWCVSFPSILCSVQKLEIRSRVKTRTGSPCQEAPRVAPTVSLQLFPGTSGWRSASRKPAALRSPRFGSGMGACINFARKCGCWKFARGERRGLWQWALINQGCPGRPWLGTAACSGSPQKGKGWEVVVVSVPGSSWPDPSVPKHGLTSTRPLVGLAARGMSPTLLRGLAAAWWKSVDWAPWAPWTIKEELIPCAPSHRSRLDASPSLLLL